MPVVSNMINNLPAQVIIIIVYYLTYNKTSIKLLFYKNKDYSWCRLDEKVNELTKK